MRAALASRNEHKLRELQAALPGWELSLLDADDYPPETGETYYENALGKALHGRSAASAGVWVLGEDSGIEVEGLGGEPGVHSARWHEGRGEVPALLERLERIEGEGRRARYVCELVALAPDGREVRGRGELRRANRRRAERQRGLRLRPDLRPRRREPHRRRPRRRLEAAELAPSPSRARPRRSARLERALVRPRAGASAVWGAVASASGRASVSHQFSSAPKTITFAIR